jgi:hypothetical protein
VSLTDDALALRVLGFHPIVERANSKMPLASGWQRLVNQTEAELRAAFDAAPAGSGVGTVTHGFIVIDVDVREGVNGYDSLRSLPPLPTTLASDTPSGGSHHFYRIPLGVEVRNSVSKLGPGIDVRGTGGQVVLPPTVIDGVAYAWSDARYGLQPMAELPAEWLELLAGPRSEPTFTFGAASGKRTLTRPEDLDMDGKRRRAYMDKLDEPSVQGAGGNAVMMKAAFRAKEFSRNPADALEELLVWNDRLATPPWDEHELARAILNSDAVLGAGLDRDREVAPVPAAPPPKELPTMPLAWVERMQAYVAREVDGSWALHNPLTEGAAKKLLVASGVKAKAAAQMLADGGVPYAKAVECAPGRPASFIDAQGRLVLNTYVPPAIQPKAGPFDVLDEVLSFLADGDDGGKRWLMNWMAFAVQNPARRLKTVPVLYGAQGTGKSLLVRVMSELMGRQNSAAIRNDDLAGRFTSHFVTKLFVSVAEIQSADVSHATANLKYLTGEPELVMEAKGANALPVKSAIKMICTSNQTLPVLVEGQGDQRWSLFRQMAEPDTGYLARTAALFDRATNDWSDAGQAELAGLLAFLLAYPVDVDLAMTPHRNAARNAAAEASRSSVEAFVEAVRGSSIDAAFIANVPEHEKSGPAYVHIHIPEQGDVISSAALQAVYRAFCKASGLMPLGTPKLVAELERFAPEWHRKRLPTNVLSTRPIAYAGVPRQLDLLPFRPLTVRQLPLVPASAHPALAAAESTTQRVFFTEEAES